MPLGRDIVEAFEAIPARIEVSGHDPVWRVTGGSFDDAVAYAREAYDDPVVVAREDRNRWWPRVTLTVTTDPGIAAGAPPIEAFRDPEPTPEPQAEPGPEPEPEAHGQPEAAVQAPPQRPAPAQPPAPPFVPAQAAVRPDPVRPDPDLRPEGDPEAEPDFQPEGDPFPLSDPDVEPDFPPDIDPEDDPHIDPELGVEEPESALEALFASQEDLWRKRPRRFPRQRQRTED